jgi:hypothetical protein
MIWFLFGCLAGLVAARWLSERRWRENAQRVQRIESGGRLYKVLPAEIYDTAVSEGAAIVPGENFKAKL